MAVVTTGMQITVASSEMADAVSRVSRAVAARASLPILSGILVEADSHGLSLTANNLSASIHVRIGALEVKHPGSTVIPAKLLRDILAGLPDAPLELSMEDTTLRLRCLRTRATIRCLDPEDWPPAEEPESWESISLPVEELTAGIAQVAGFASTAENRPVYTAVLMEVDEHGLTMVATDAYRVAECRLPLDEGAASWGRLLVPAKVMSDLPRVLKGENGDVTIRVSPRGNQVAFRLGASEIRARVIDGQYPNYKQVILDSFPTIVRLPKAGLDRALGACLAFADEERHAVRLLVDDGRLMVTAAAADVGGGEAEMDAELTGEPATIHLNATFLRDALDVIGDTVELRISGPKTPMLIVDPDDDGYRHVVLPINVPSAT